MFFCTLICAESVAISRMVQEYREIYNTYLVEDLFFRMGLPSIMPLVDRSSFKLDTGADSTESSCRCNDA